VNLLLIIQGQALVRVPGIHRESLTLIFTMVDRCDPDSPHAAYWASLPKTLMSGMTVPFRLLLTFSSIAYYSRDLHILPDSQCVISIINSLNIVIIIMTMILVMMCMFIIVDVSITVITEEFLLRP
jgi:hypothetical protein